MINTDENPEFLNSFLEYTATILNKSPNTVKEYNYDINRFLKYIKKLFHMTDVEDLSAIPIKDMTIETISKITLDDIHSYLFYLANTFQSKPATRARKASSIRVFFNYLCQKKGLIDANPALNLETPKIGKRMPRYLSLDESKKLLSATIQDDNDRNKERDFAIITLFLNCGMRLSELVGININDIEFSECKMNVIGKGNKERTIYLNKACMEAINQYLSIRSKQGIRSGSEKALFLSERLERIRKDIVNPLMKLKSDIDNDKTAEGISKSIYKFLVEENIAEKINKKIEELEKVGQVDLVKEYQSSLQTILDILDEIVLVFSDDKMTIDKYAQILKVGFKNSNLTKIPGTQDQVIMGDVDRSRSHKVKAIFIIGLNDGEFPSVHKDEGFLNDLDRETLKQDGIELAKGTIENLYEDNFNIYKAFSTAEEKLYLLYSSSDVQGKALRPSMLINKIKKIYPMLQEESDVIETKAEVLNKKTTYDELIIQLSKLKEQDEIDKVWYYVYDYYKKDTEWNTKLEQNLKGLNYTNIPEKIEQTNIDKLYGNTLVTSISKLERYRSCPFSYYLQYGLKIKPEEELKIQTLNTGTFIHEIIDEFFEAVREAEIKLAEITDEQLAEIINKIIDEKLKQSQNYIFTSTAKYRALVVRLKKIIQKALKYIIGTLVQSRFEVLGTEVEFGEKGKYKPIRLTLEDGKRIEIIGKIDRIDTAQSEDGRYLRIIDYKSSAKNIDLNEVYAGLQIQLLTYLDAACKEEDLMPAGVLYFSMLEQMIKADKRMEQEEIEEKIRANFKMKGLILADVNVVKLHDKKLEKGSSALVPAYIDKEGNLSEKKTSGVTAEQFEELQKYMYIVIKQISKEILGGNIDLKPYYKDKKTPCKYCDYKSVCGFNMGGCENNYNYIDKKSKEEILAKIKKCEGK